jgi:hypothetical protein
MSLSERLFNSELERTRNLVHSPDWYIEYGKTQRVRTLGLGALQAAKSGSISEARQHFKRQQLDIFEQLLTENAVRVGRPEIDEVENWDQERAPVDRIVIHHSHREKGISLTQLNAMHLLRLYLPRYQRGDLVTSAGQLQPIYSAHFNDEGEQVFYGYHWKVDQDGEVNRLLPDSALAWHAGNWEINKRSVGIVIDDDLTDRNPTPRSLNAVADILSGHYGSLNLSHETILGHKAVSNTLCPGNKFDEGWKQDLLSKLD